jgi:carbonic anhydrase
VQAPASNGAVSPDGAIKRLVEGNQRYLASRSQHARADQARRCDTFTTGQHPFAVVLACADSRAPVELIFDQGIGDLFVVRVAGNVADTDEIGTIEYGAAHLNTPLVVVLGHSKCGAVTAVVDGAKVSDNIARLVDNIAPAVEDARHQHPGATGEALVAGAVEANVMQSIQDLLSRSEEVRHLVASSKVKVVGAVYDLHTGTIQWLGEHAKQTELLKASPGHANKHQEHHAAPDDAETHATPGAKPAHDPTQKRDEASSKDNGATMPHQSGTLGGMLIPAAFIGGAGLVSSSIFFRMKARAPVETVTAVESH